MINFGAYRMPLQYNIVNRIGSITSETIGAFSHLDLMDLNVYGTGEVLI